MKNFTLLLIFLAMLSAQGETITGKVSDADGGLFGATILVKGTKNATTTDFDGNYSIEADETDTLIFNYTGYGPQEIVVGNQTVINVTMEESLEAVVVMGYRTTTKRRMTSSISVVTSETVNNRSNSSITQRLQGQVAGLNIQAVTGQPGANSQILIRGRSTISGTEDPLYIVDGVPVSSSNFRNLQNDDIDTIAVLKDASATAIYGNRGANGVVIITTLDSDTDDDYHLPEELKKNFPDYENHIVEVDDYEAYLQEQYAKIVENRFENVLMSPLSTFSIDVDKASYSNVRRMINDGLTVNPNAVKIEEMVNYFSYDYPQPQDEHPFSINTEVVKTPWREDDTQLVRIGLQGKSYEQDELPASNLTFLLDVSGSIDDTHKLGLLKKAFKLLINQLREKDKVSIVVYAGAAGVVLPPTSGADKQTIIKALENLQAGGSTAGGAGIELAYKIAQENFIKDGNNRIILATDGDFNVGVSSNGDLEDLIIKKRKSGVFLSVLGFGYGNYKDEQLETLADKGNGNHAYIDTMQEAQKVFGKEFGGTLYTIAKDVKIQIEFNPSLVSSYRLIGYENRLLNDEDFVDDTIDAGELGSGHTVTALYEIIPVDKKTLEKQPELKYQKSIMKTDHDDELFTVKFRYKKPDGDKSIEMVHVQKNKTIRASDDMQFAASVALLGMHLRNSEYDGDTTMNDIIKLAKSGVGRDKNGYRKEFVRLLKTYKSYKVSVAHR